MEESFKGAKEELKRVDHLIYVSLKYTRTCDIFKSIIQRLIDAIDFMFMALLKGLEQQQKIMDIPAQPGIKANMIKENFPEEKYEQLHKIVEFYLLLRQMNRAEFSRAREFRRHVTMTMTLDGEEHEVNIDKVTEYYHNTKEYLKYILDIAKEDFGMDTEE